MSGDIMNRVNVLVKKTYYAHERFEIDATFALIYHELPLDVMNLSKHVRVSDHLIQLDEHHFFLIFTFTSEENAYKAAQNILLNLDHYFNNRTTHIALDSFDLARSPQSILNRLRQILTESRKNPFVRIETEDILDH
ncbi:hypothetical protein [Sulfuricurvum sp.]|uniref:hypothetical protein n=1 Tax=Sulfuricurvum sp. TaxID=2025608 RepID=UPI00262B104F|nr:hypothetical protein [Sulfuricurvum sp.]MDD4884774.1 hypothetical protein [Sulfuricurvum sp.]